MKKIIVLFSFLISCCAINSGEDWETHKIIVNEIDITEQLKLCIWNNLIGPENLKYTFENEGYYGTLTFIYESGGSIYYCIEFFISDEEYIFPEDSLIYLIGEIYYKIPTINFKYAVQNTKIPRDINHW
jgi:hypothetical protein